MKNIIKETKLGNWANPISATTVGGNTPKNPTRGVGFDPKGTMPLSPQHPNEEDSKAPKILPFPMDQIVDDLVNAYNHTNNVSSMIKICLNKNQALVKNRRKELKRMFRRALIAKNMIKSVYTQLNDLTL